MLITMFVLYARLRLLKRDEPRHEKTFFSICENKGADQLHTNCAADHCLCFRYIDSTIAQLPKSEISNL